MNLGGTIEAPTVVIGFVTDVTAAVWPPGRAATRAEPNDTDANLELRLRTAGLRVGYWLG